MVLDKNGASRRLPFGLSYKSEKTRRRRINHDLFRHAHALARGRARTHALELN